MANHVISTSNTKQISEQNKVVSLFEFIKEMNKLKQKSILNMSEHFWSQAISKLPNDSKNISVFYRDRVADDDNSIGENGSALLSVRRPEFDRCPEPDATFIDWIESGWESFRKDVKTINSREFELTEEELELALTATDSNEEQPTTRIEYFTDNDERVSAYNVWFAKRSEWVEKQKITQATRNLFADLYRLYFELQKESETKELVVANGVLCDRLNPHIKHPVLTKRVKLNYDPSVNTITIEEIDSSSELYTVIFQMMDDINLSAINTLQADLQKNDYHPLDRNETPDFLKILVHQLSSESEFSKDKISVSSGSNNRLLLYLDPCFIMRKRLDGTLKAIEQIIENIQETSYIPAPIKDIVSGGKIDVPEEPESETIEEQLASVGGESIDVLLSKEANKEQLEIAKRIERYNAVLVQGPPGTGKTHTIANLLGHFLAQGKSVLVTSHTPKALSVLKDKIAPGLRHLCVSMLEDSNIDMERSVDGITDVMSATTSFEIKKEMDAIALERRDIVNKLADIRRKIFQIINQESNCIVYNGEEISPSKAAAFVLANAEELSYIPGKVQPYAPLPLSSAELSELYRSNEFLSAEDEAELERDIPYPEDIIVPIEFQKIGENLRSAVRSLNDLSNNAAWSFTHDEINKKIIFKKADRHFILAYPDFEKVCQLKEYAQSFDQIKDWMKNAAVDGKNGGAYISRWQGLISLIQETCAFAESIMAEQFGKKIEFSPEADINQLTLPLNKLKNHLEQHGKLTKLALAVHKDFAITLDNISVNSRPIQSAKECDIAIHIIELAALRNQCAAYWDELLATHGVPAFYTLDESTPERIANNWIPEIKVYLDWYKNEYGTLLAHLDAVGIPSAVLFASDPLDSDVVATSKILSTVSEELPDICDICLNTLIANECKVSLLQNKTVLQRGKRSESYICNNIVSANDAGDYDAYAEAYTMLENMYQKYELRQSRDELLQRMEIIAPQWAAAIRNRNGIHGECTVPETIQDAWRWKQFSLIIDELTAKPFSALQKESIQLSKEYRKVTALYAEKSAWYHLLHKTEGDIDMRHALQGWKQTVKKIGKGTGKNAPALKAKARELMSKCQSAVPSWIMPINRALESLNPKENRFDIIIIDEASQSDVSSLAILYMGKKLIIVGDDKQVSPMAVGVEVNKMNALQEMHIKDKIPNAHLYDAKTSIYDIAKTTFQPLMLREHFRCVPEIIGFSNMLSYDYKIKPLRDASNSTILPAVVNYRVPGGQRLNNKTNPIEADAIVALIQACIDQPEYAGKTFGVISLLGDEQANIIQSKIEERIDHSELVSRSILCGNASNFQGDERDIVFLSMVDSGSEDGPLPMHGFGPDDSYRKRYNVAASRAKDQLWVVDSLDSSRDLKPGDIRKMLIDYSLNPAALELRHAEIQEKAESPFEVGVATALSDRGYHLEHQWKVGAYRLDMVAVYGKKTVAIECDGERYHSGVAKVRGDMERQTILERLGWRFIRVRGSEYFRNPEEAIERIVQELTDYGIMPEEQGKQAADISRNTDLLNRVKARAITILSDTVEISPETAYDTIAVALDPKSIVPESAPEVKETIQPAVVERPVLESRAEPTTEKIAVEDELPESHISEATEPQKQPNISTGIQVEMILPTEENISATTENVAHEAVIVKSKVQPEKKAEKLSISKPAASDRIRQKPVGEPKSVVKPAPAKAATESVVKEDVIALLEREKVPYVDKRSKGGALWIIGGKELSDVVRQCKALGIRFNFKVDGGKATKGKDGWWAK